ncbi:MAG: energy transducer TonB [Christiangramia sp.]|nr:energy transducer TonB [Christiangramia sp.]
MTSKKNPRADLNRYKMIFFQIGLIITLGLTYIGIEWSFDPATDYVDQKVQIDMEMTEDIPITEIKADLPPPPPPPVVPEVIEVVEDDLEVEETEIESTESSIDDKMEDIVQVSEVVEQKIEEAIEDVPFVLIERVPVYPGCENQADNAAKKKCMSDRIQEYVKQEFNNNLGAELGLEGVNRIMVVFRIGPDGYITDIKARAPHVDLEAEAVRVVKLLPRMTPGYQRNRPVGVIYTLPIVFEVRPRA